MEDNKGTRSAGTKVSQIANIFQNRTHREDIIIIRNKPKPPSPTPEKKETVDPHVVTVMRTESHVARFNNARALFEKLGEENKSISSKFNPLQTTKSASSIQDLRSRSSSVNSENKDRSPSPNRDLCDVLISNKVLINDTGNVKSPSNGHRNEPPKVNGEKPLLMKKPEKPERKFNSKELIEKQRNWPSHFSKTRSNRCNSDPSKTDVKLAVSNGRTPTEIKTNSSATRSASFNNRLQTPPTSPTSQEVTKRHNVTRKDRPASVIPHITTNTTSPGNETRNNIKIDESKNHVTETKNGDCRMKSEQSNDTNCNYRKIRTPLPLPDLDDDVDEVCKKEKELEDKENLYSCVKKKDKRDDSVVKVNLANASLNLESKTESEKQEHEDDEKHFLGKF